MFKDSQTHFQFTDPCGLRGLLAALWGGVDTDLDLCLFAHHGRCWVSLLVLRTSVDHRERKRLKTSENVEDRGKEGRVR